MEPSTYRMEPGSDSMEAFTNESTGPTPYPSEGQPPYPSGDRPPYPSDEKPPYPDSDSSFTRTDSSFSQGSASKRKLRLMDYRPPPRQARAVLQKAPAQQTEYMGMLLHQSQVIEKGPQWNIIAATCTWILLAGFIVLPGTYVEFQKSDVIKEAAKDQSNLGNRILSSFANIGLLIVAAVLSGIGALGITGLWLKWRANYIWLINKVLLPALLNSAMGLISTLVNVLSKPDKTFNVIALVTTCVTGGLALILSGMFLYYNNYLLAAVKADHRRAYGSEDVKDAINSSNGQQVAV